MGGNAHSSTHSGLQKMSDKAQKKAEKERRRQDRLTHEIGLDLNRPINISRGSITVDGAGRVEITDREYSKPSRHESHER